MRQLFQPGRHTIDPGVDQIDERQVLQGRYIGRGPQCVAVQVQRFQSGQRGQDRLSFRIQSDLALAQHQRFERRQALKRLRYAAEAEALQFQSLQSAEASEKTSGNLQPWIALKIEMRDVSEIGAQLR
ncbi:hypothetical protein D3C72_679470 [compost metagenome]